MNMLNVSYANTQSIPPMHSGSDEASNGSLHNLADHLLHAFLSGVPFHACTLGHMNLVRCKGFHDLADHLLDAC